jgi:two-component system response regulator YesN
MARAMRISLHLKRGRVFYSYLLSYSVVLLIPILVTVALFNRAHATVSAEADRANELLLNQVKSHLDMVMADVQKLSSLVSHNNVLQGLLYRAQPITNDEYYRSYLTVNDFRAYLLAHNSIVDFLVYLPRLDLILSPRGFFRSSGYHSAQMSRTGLSYESWMAQFRPLARRAYGGAVV